MVEMAKVECGGMERTADAVEIGPEMPVVAKAATVEAAVGQGSNCLPGPLAGKCCKFLQAGCSRTASVCRS